jgi:DNA sulfur modification protein DndD
MLIKSIRMKNFRQFKGSQILEFACDTNKNVTVLLGDNTFGKTTILQAFNWCLYDIAEFPKDSNPDFLLNLEIADESAGVQQKEEVEVEVELQHKGVIYNILRTRTYVDRAVGNWNALPDTISITYKEGGITNSVREGEEKNVINAILPQSLSGYFFFDTERVSDISARGDLSEAVRGLLGLSAVGNARIHLGDRTHKTSAIGQWSNSLDFDGDDRAKAAQETISKETDNIENLEQEIKDTDNELQQLNIQKEKIADILRENQSTAELQRKKQDCERQLEELRKTLAHTYKSFIDFYNNGIVSYLMDPLMDQAEQCLVTANVDDKGIRDMTEASIRDIIKRGRCLCGAEIIEEKDGIPGNDVYNNIIDEIKYLPPAHLGTAVCNFKSLIANDKRNMSQFFPTIEQKYKEIQRLRNEIVKIDNEISSIDSSIFGKENMSNYESSMNLIKVDIKRMNDKKERCNRDIGAAQSAIEQAQKVSDSLVSASARNQELIRFIAYAEKICVWIDATYAEKESEMREKLQDKVNELLKKMYHGERRVQIDKQYRVTLFSQVNGKEKVTGESEGLKRVKNFAFISGLVELAKEKACIGKNPSDSVSWENEAYPLVMDAPFSNADETHIRNIACVLPEVANQVIMFVMEKDWQYAEYVIVDRVGKHCSLKKHSETKTTIEG